LIFEAISSRRESQFHARAQSVPFTERVHSGKGPWCLQEKEKRW